MKEEAKIASLGLLNHRSMEFEFLKNEIVSRSLIIKYLFWICFHLGNQK